jgi:hypothetical protein
LRVSLVVVAHRQPVILRPALGLCDRDADRLAFAMPSASSALAIAIAFSRAPALKWRIETGKSLAFHGIVSHRRVSVPGPFEPSQRGARSRSR